MIPESIIKKINKALYVILISLMVLLMIESLAYNHYSDSSAPAPHLLDHWTLAADGKEEDVALPCGLDPSSPRSTVVLSAEVTPNPGDSLYVKTVYAPLRVYIDGSLAYEYGHGRLFPTFLSDPPTNVAIVPITEFGHPISLRLEYLSPVSRDRLALHPVLMGSSDAITDQLFSEMGFSLFFSVTLLALGIILLFLSLLVTRLHRAGLSFFWLGLFSLSVGAWVLGECNLTAVFLHNPPLLYLMAFIGLFSFSIPLFKFVLLISGLQHKKPVVIMGHILTFCLMGALLLQLTGLVQFTQSMYLFHILQPLALCILGGSIFMEAVPRHNPTARRFAFPMLVLAVFSILEVANYYILRLTSQMSLFFQIGVLIFVFMVILICGDYVKNAFTAQSERQRLEYENHLMERQIAVQKERYATLTQIDAEIRAQRHDMRHQFIVLRRFAENGDLDKLSEYLDTLTVNIPVPLLRYCENETVNAVASYYAALAQKAGIKDCDISLEIPEQTGRVPENTLCIIIGNLLENALEACRYVQEDSSFIHIKSRLHYGTLTIVMDNSFQSVALSADGHFLSHKQGGGTGLRSITAAAEKYDGGTQFMAAGNRFSSSVYLQLF